MKMIKMALLGGAALTATAVAAQADDLDALKAQIETLNARVAAMESAPAVPAGYQLVTVSTGDMQATPGLGFTARERAAYGNKSTVISVLPTADAPAGTTISWSGYARAAVVFNDAKTDVTVKRRDTDTGAFIKNDADSKALSSDPDADTDVTARGQIRVKASTDTAVGTVGVDIRFRGDFDGNGNANAYSDVAWGYWSMTPELTLGGGYAGSLGNIGYGMDGACNCYITDTVAFNPGDTTQMRLTYASGPFSTAIALEDGTTGKDGISSALSGRGLGVAGEMKYSSDSFSGEISGVWRDISGEGKPATPIAREALSDSLWQIGAGVGANMGDAIKVSLAAAVGEGPAVTTSEGEITKALPWNNKWWGVSGIVSVGLTDGMHAELGAGYKKRDFDSISSDTAKYSAESDNWVVGGGVYYDPVEQLTIGVEASYSDTQGNVNKDAKTASSTNQDAKLDLDSQSTVVDLVTVWRF